MTNTPRQIRLHLANGHIFVGYGGPGLPDGSDGKSSYIIEYTMTGAQVHVYSVLGHNDGLKLNPYDGKLYAMQNEDANPNLVIIDPVTKTAECLQICVGDPTPRRRL